MLIGSGKLIVRFSSCHPNLPPLPPSPLQFLSCTFPSQLARESAQQRASEAAAAAARAAEAEESKRAALSRADKAVEELGVVRRALEASLARINRMSTDSDFTVDR